MKKFFIASLAVVIVLTVAITVVAHVGSPMRTAQLPRILYTEVFEQEGDIYFVYFWRNDCPRCAEFEPYVVEAFNQGVPVYVVDMNHRQNHHAWFRGGIDRDEDLGPNDAPNLRGVTNADELAIRFTPSLYRIEHGVITEQGIGVLEAVDLLNGYESKIEN